ncbi:type II toxin-antitoxin system RelB family antitoxin [Lacicoccus alkaliphilus]|nr:DUF6290 family protein [Salinicoccus alkaliphilus]
MGTITVRMNKDEQEAFEAYAKLHGAPLSTIMKQALEERIEDEFDLELLKSYEADVQNDDVTVYDHDEMKKMLGL